MEKLNQSIRDLKIKLLENKDLTNEEWNIYANEHLLYSAVTIETHLGLKNWLELKNKMLANYLCKNSSKGRFYREEELMGKMYDISYRHLQLLTNMLNEFPSVEEWNQYAKENLCLNSQSMQYIAGMNWHKLRDKIRSKQLFKSYRR